MGSIVVRSGPRSRGLNRRRQSRSGITRSMAAPGTAHRKPANAEGTETSREAPDRYDVRRVQARERIAQRITRGSGRLRWFAASAAGIEHADWFGRPDMTRRATPRRKLIASMTPPMTKRVKKRRRRQPENLAGASEANRTISTRAQNHSRWSRKRAGVG
jgi:hypothetical protein